MTKAKISNLGTSHDNKNVYIDYNNTNVEYHLLETPDLISLVEEVIPKLRIGDEDQVVLSCDLGRIVGTTNLVKTKKGDEIVYAKRIGRTSYSRFVKYKKPVECSSIVIVLRKCNTGYNLWTSMCGNILPKEAYIEDSNFNNTHALVYDEKLIQPETATYSKP